MSSPRHLPVITKNNVVSIGHRYIRRIKKNQLLCVKYCLLVKVHSWRVTIRCNDKRKHLFTAVDHILFGSKIYIRTICTYFFRFLISEFEMDDNEKYLRLFFLKRDYNRKISSDLNYNVNSESWSLEDQICIRELVSETELLDKKL